MQADTMTKILQGKEQPREYAIRRYRETGQHYLCTGLGHTWLDVPDNRRDVDEYGGIVFSTKEVQS